MDEIEKIKVGDIDYVLIDTEARQDIDKNTNDIAKLSAQVNGDIKNTLDALGDLAFKDDVRLQSGGTFVTTDANFVSSISKTTIYSCTSVGALPELTAQENHGVLTLYFNQGALPQRRGTTVVSNVVAKASATTGNGIEVIAK